MPIVLNGSGPVTGVTSLNTTVSDTEIGYLDGVTSALQTQINTAGGLVKITDATFSGSSAVNVNDCFSSTYAHYALNIDLTGSALGTLQFRLRVSGADNTTSNYNNQRVIGSGASATAAQNTSQTLARIGEYDTPECSANYFIYNPQASKDTTLHGIFNRTGSVILVYGARFAATTSFTGFSLIPDTGTISGTLRVYGIRN